MTIGMLYFLNQVMPKFDPIKDGKKPTVGTKLNERVLE
jgi:hypothetical protein